ncbi:hypothetical protein B0T14DRAFT_250364 [Immersiella caudata]|uniref:Nephrocystin 3-like N-terminal domain-containing protein n=1 Tax=Immersiella caudata TaxID=314043 RepID=A0AA39WJL3_9PEZI|nr:hypothetical protein B0T14DRAFT_250364 [Immersiella caudata]
MANSQMRSDVLAGLAKVASLLVQCDTYQELYISPDPSLRPPADVLDRLKTSIVQAYTKLQNFLAFIIRSRQSSLKPVHAWWKLEDVQGHVVALSESERLLRQVAEDCEKQCNLASRSNIGELLKLASEFQDQLKLALEDIDVDKEVEILEWISLVEYPKHHEEVKKSRVEDTCEWLLRDQRFLDWENSASSAVLWLRGDPGTGKTFLTSKIVDHIQSRPQSSVTRDGFAYFYCKRNEKDREDHLSILRSYVRQLSTSLGKPGYIRKQLGHVRREARRKGWSGLSLQSCQDQLLESVDVYATTTLVLDALDECDPTALDQFITTIEGLLSQTSNILRVFIASRPDAEIRRQFSSRPNIEIQAKDNKADIQKFLDKSVVKKESWPPLLPGVIKDALLQHSDGMFLWAKLQVDQIKECETDEAVRDQLKALPRGLKETYDAIFERINTRNRYDKSLVERAILWVMCAYTPLTSDLLLPAIRVTSQGESLDLASEITAITLQDLCNNLLVLDSERYVWRFSHISVLEYFEKEHFGIAAAHNHVAKVCLRLLLESRKERGSTPDLLQPRHPLQVYSWRNMAAHLQTAESRPSGPILGSMLAALQETPWGKVLLFAARNRDAEQEALVAARLRFHSQGTSPALLEILLDIILYRYYRLLYHKNVHERWVTRRPLPENHPSQQQVGTETDGMPNPPSF